jgi:hypothetical protein
LFTLALAACGQPAPKSEQTGQDEAGAPPPAPVHATPKLYDPISKTAEAITDTLEIVDLGQVGPNAPPRVKITLGFGHVYEADWVNTAKASADVGGEAWTALLPIPEDVTVTVYAVQSELVNAKAENGGLCKPEATSFIAIAEYKNALDEQELQMAAFKDKTWPPKAAPDLCGTFTYIAHTGK